MLLVRALAITRLAKFLEAEISDIPYSSLARLIAFDNLLDIAE